MPGFGPIPGVNAAHGRRRPQCLPGRRTSRCGSRAGAGAGAQRLRTTLGQLAPTPSTIGCQYFQAGVPQQGTIFGPGFHNRSPARAMSASVSARKRHSHLGVLQAIVLGWPGVLQGVGRGLDRPLPPVVGAGPTRKTGRYASDEGCGPPSVGARRSHRRARAMPMRARSLCGSGATRFFAAGRGNGSRRRG